jgi:hypothetical protein
VTVVHFMTYSDVPEKSITDVSLFGFIPPPPPFGTYTAKQHRQLVSQQQERELCYFETTLNLFRYSFLNNAIRKERVSLQSSL